MSNALYTPTADFKIERSPLTVLQTDMHYHHAYQLYYAIEGEHEYLIGDTFYKISKGDLVWIPVDTVHCTDRKSASRFLVYFKPSFVNKYVQPLMRDKLLGSAPFVFHGDASTDAQLFELFNKLHSEYSRQQKQPQYADELLLVKYLLQIMFLLYTAENVYSPAIPEDNRMSNILKYVNENYPDSKIKFVYDTRLEGAGSDKYYKTLGGKGSYPMTVIVDKKGKIQFVREGSMTYEQLELLVDSYLYE